MILLSLMIPLTEWGKGKSREDTISKTFLNIAEALLKVCQALVETD